MEITFLGTGAVMPTKQRNHSSLLVSYKSEGILVDCGEGTQRQMRLSGIKPTKITIILISHWHGDHVLGLPGLLQTLSVSEYSNKLRIYGPIGTKKYFEFMNQAFVFDSTIELEVNEVTNEEILDKKDFYIEAYELEHGIRCLGFRIIEKDRRKINMAFIKKLGIPEGPLLGKLQSNKSIVWKEKKVTPTEATYVVKGRIVGIINDTVLCNNCFKIAEDADVLVCEATYADDMQEKAEEYKHLTAKQAALIASRANAKKLVLTHFSPRYKDAQQIEEEARTVFDNVVCAEDFMKIKI